MASSNFEFGPNAHEEAARPTCRGRGAHLEGSYPREKTIAFNGPGASHATQPFDFVSDGGPRGFLMPKDRPVRGKVKIRERTEIAVSDAPPTMDLLQQLGFEVACLTRSARDVCSTGLLLR